MPRSYLGLTAAAIALVVAGCGSSSSSSTSTSASAVAPASSASVATATQTTPKVTKPATAKATAKAKARAAKPKAAKPKLAAVVKTPKPVKVAAKPKPKPKPRPAAPAKPKPVASAAALDVGTRTLPPGTVLVDSQGKTLYTFAPDKHSMVTCTGSCAAVWPPLMLTGTEKPVATAGVAQSMLGSDPYPGGGRVVTYDGWPLYTFSGDSGPGSANGQGEDINGGMWFVISPSGMQITKK